MHHQPKATNKWSTNGILSCAAARKRPGITLLPRVDTAALCRLILFSVMSPMKWKYRRQLFHDEAMHYWLRDSHALFQHFQRTAARWALDNGRALMRQGRINNSAVLPAQFIADEISSVGLLTGVKHGVMPPIYQPRWATTPVIDIMMIMMA